MKIRFRKQAYGTYGEAGPGDERDVAKTLGRELVANGIAEAVGEEADDAEDEGEASAEAEQPAAIVEGEAAAETSGDEADEAGSAATDTPAARRAARRRQAG